MTTSDIARRHAIRRLALAGLGVAVSPGWGADLVAQALAHADPRAPATLTAWKPAVFTAHQEATVSAIAEAIIPQTDTPGARAARVSEFIDAVLADAEPGTRNRFFNGLSWVDQRARSQYGIDFVDATQAQQAALLTPLNRPVATPAPGKGEKESTHVTTQPLERDRAESPPDPTALEFFKSIKSMTITGYYTSEVGMKEELGDDGNVFFEDYLGCDDPASKRKPSR